ncbi:MAG: siderophore-interacting protein [Aeromicrobium sp.]|uniref:siderophore-interacting protein n=1 Tax=Aeromicrobium sp. TaxID=1871063 RepID=UPI0039E60F42
MPRPPLTGLTVLRADALAPSMRRVVLGGDGFAEVAGRWQGFTDSYVKLAFAVPGSDDPVLRTYTVRRLDPQAGELWIDIVTHGDDGLAGPWAQRVRPGEEISLRGPGGAYRPDPEADHHLFVGDEAALPAIAASLESLVPGQRATAFVEVDGPADEQPVDSAGDVEIIWLHRAPAPAGSTDLLDRAVRAWDWPAGRVQAFVHGESALLKTVRPYLAKDRALPRVDLSVSAYWRRGETEEGFRAWKQAERACGDEPMWRPGR